MPKHTPGPWRRVQNWRGKIAVVGPRNDGKSFASDRICNVPMRKDQSGLCDAALIAAAPDLLASLKVAVEFFDNNGGDRDYSWLPQLRAAIAKAEAVKTS